MSRGWYNESTRHSLASRGIATTTNVEKVRSKEVVINQLNTILDREHITKLDVSDFNNDIESMFVIKDGDNDIPSSVVYDLKDRSLSINIRFPEKGNAQKTSEKIENVIDDAIHFADWCMIHRGEGRNVPHVEVLYENVNYRNIDEIIEMVYDWVEKVMESDIYD